MIDLEKYKISEFLNSQVSKISKITHFYKDTDNDFSSIEEGYIWFSDLLNFNDPFEVNIKDGDIDFKVLDESQMVSFLMNNPFVQLCDGRDKVIIPFQLSRDVVERIVDKNFEALQEPLNEIVMNYVRRQQENKFQCFSHDAVNKDIVKSRLMWSHYARGLRGFAVEFEFDPLLDSMFNLNRGYFNGYSLINYTELGFNDYILNVTNNAKPLFVDRMMFTKHIDWEYEQEVRIMVGRNRGYYDSSCISRVIVGQKMIDSNKEKMSEILDKKGLKDKLYVANFDRRDFSIHINKFE
ncbi:hypothetical protein KU74_18730 [Pectobacterium brasiliense]|uniref:DUF2971 domain-containing protein n=1 Tax=Pectobacterium brasiliense TaxID=180957 RepID=A0A0M2EYZ1_9GAMM|nr:DUF2971 domain-containing protein [Pectobacterium brasiliense]KGA32321.1 hypothetical protein KU74_18730 [Pectobacterium brasiliense]